jgi:Protein of unknown function (DUF3309)
VRHRTDRLDRRDDNCSDFGLFKVTVWCVRKLNDETRRSKMSIGLILLIVLVLALVGVIPTWGHSRSWGYAPSGVVGLLVVILVVMLVTGNI